METDNDEKEIRLRDQFAIAAMQALVETTGLYKTFIEKGDVEEKGYHEKLVGRLERLSIISYKIADSMRKARLQVFK
jgi:hypothetical protein